MWVPIGKVIRSVGVGYGLLFASWGVPSCFSGVYPQEVEVDKAAQKVQPPPAVPEAAQEDRTLQLLGFQHLRLNSDQTMRAEGGIRLQWRHYLLSAEQVEGSLKEGQFLFSRGANLEGEDLQARGERLWLDTRRKRWWLEGGSATLRPPFVKGYLLEDLFLQGQRVEGEPQQIGIETGKATTCDLEAPHYELSSETVQVIPDERMVLRGIRLQVLGHTWFRLPYLVVPLKGVGQRSLLPEVGFSEEEGYYLKYVVGYLLSQAAPGNARIDFMQRKGIGLGIDQDYPQGSGTVYFLNDRSLGSLNLNARLHHRQMLGRLQTTSDFDYRRNSYLLAPNSTAWNFVTNWLLPSKGGSTQLSARLSHSQTGDFESRNDNYSFQEIRSLGKWRWNLSGDYLSYRSLTGGEETSRRREVNLRLNIGYDWQTARAELAYQRSIPVGSSAPFFSGLEQTPELILHTTTRQLGLRGLDSNLRFSVGQLSESGAQSVRTQRYSFEWQGSFSSASLSWQYGFRQHFYGDGTAQYLLRSDLEQRWRWGQDSTFSLRWNYLRPYGYSPLFVDRVGLYNQLGAELRWFVGGGWSLSAQTVYDLLAPREDRARWQPLWLNLLYEQGEWFRWRTNAIYDPNTERFTSVSSALSWQFGASHLYLTARYDPQRRRWGSTNLRLDSLQWGKFHFSALLFYNGYLNRFEGRHFLVTYDLHCAQLELRYIENPFGFRRDKEILLFLRLKAFPALSRFGYGQFGQSLGGIGEIY